MLTPPRHTPERSRPASPWYRNLTVVSVVCLGLGVVLGPLSDAVTIPGEEVFGAALAAIARAWTNALRLIVVPLVMAQLFAVVASSPTGRQQAGRVGWTTPIAFTALLVLVASVTVVLVSALVTLPIFQAIAPPLTASAAPGGPAPQATGVAWVDEFVPSNLFATAASDNLVGLMVVTVIFACAASRLDETLRASLTTVARAVSGACFIIVDWILLVTPAAVFALAYQMSSGDNLSVGGMLLAYVGVELTALAAGLVLLYLVVVLTGSAPFMTFARAASAAQLAAVTSRSSLATVPPLMRDAKALLGIPDSVASYVLPLAGATLKVSRAVTSPTKLVFLAALVGLDLSWAQVATAVTLLLLQSPSTTGVARVTSGARSLPIYMAVGIPGEYALLAGTATAVTDWLMTLVNTTSYLTATTLVARWLHHKAPADRRAVEDQPASAGAHEMPAPLLAPLPSPRVAALSPRREPLS